MIRPQRWVLGARPWDGPEATGTSGSLSPRAPLACAAGSRSPDVAPLCPLSTEGPRPRSGRKDWLPRLRSSLRSRQRACPRGRVLLLWRSAHWAERTRVRTGVELCREQRINLALRSLQSRFGHCPSPFLQNAKAQLALLRPRPPGAASGASGRSQRGQHRGHRRQPGHTRREAQTGQLAVGTGFMDMTPEGWATKAKTDQQAAPRGGAARQRHRPAGEAL